MKIDNFYFIKQIRALVLLVILFLISCRKEMNLISSQQNMLLLDELIYTDQESKVQIVYSYDDSLISSYSKISEINGKISNDVTTLIRDNNKLIYEIKTISNRKLKDDLSGNSVTSIKETKIFYNDQNQIRYKVSIENINSTTSNFIVLDSISYQYNGKIIKSEEFVALPPNGYEKFNVENIVYDTNGNKSGIKFYIVVNGLESFIQELILGYDQKPNAFYSNDDALAFDLFNSNEIFDITSTFNITKYKLTHSNSSLNKDYNISYIYDKQYGKPVSAVIKSNSKDIGTIKFNYKFK